MENILTSASNPTIKRLRKLVSSAKTRREENSYIAEGIHLVESFLHTDQAPSIYVLAESALNNPEVKELITRLAETGAERVVVADSLFESIMSIHASVGVCILFSPKAELPADIQLAHSAVLLDDIQDPGNLGTILRTVAAVGIVEVVLSAGCASPWSPKALRAGMGAQFGLTIHDNVNLAKVVSQAAIPTLATTLKSDSQPLFSLDLRGPVAWVFGSEGQGLDDELAVLASRRVSIPQENSAIESLNVAAAAAVCLYEHYRQSTL